MIDIVFSKEFSNSEIIDFFSKVFICTSRKIKVLNAEIFYSLNVVLDTSDIECLCVYSRISGDASLLLQLFNYKISNEEVFSRVFDVASARGVDCYIPYDNFDNWIHINTKGLVNYVKQVESNDSDFFYFSELKYPPS